MENTPNNPEPNQPPNTPGSDQQKIDPLAILLAGLIQQKGALEDQFSTRTATANLEDTVCFLGFGIIRAQAAKTPKNTAETPCIPSTLWYIPPPLKGKNTVSR